MRQGDDALITLQFCGKRISACTRNLIIDTPLIVHFGVNPLVTLSDQSRIEHAFERAVECARTHGDLPLRVCFDLFHDAVTVTLSAGECQENMKDSWSE